ncbi:hypothetical protein K788_00007475 (plasmid) [Paraburkholderia caribensis MBA4]|uniref:Uncharacterized protein n=1 Tax=Paraburkholderia caribensis MBA4 TaxID=1323664 RepID=A0A0P0RMY9_9BURK|nr:hypothetical protein K788_00007475 [Paraburkholderia caribensis MBA4]
MDVLEIVAREARAMGCIEGMTETRIAHQMHEATG